MVACQNKASARPDQPCKLVKNVGRQDPPRRMPAFRPGVGKQNIGPGKRPAFQSAKDQPDIIVPDTDVVEPLFLDMANKAGNAVDEGLGTDKSGVGTRRGDGDKIFPRHQIRFPEKVLGAPSNCASAGLSGRNRSSGRRRSSISRMLVRSLRPLRRP